MKSVIDSNGSAAEEEVLRQFVARKGLRQSTSRVKILRVFAAHEGHVSAADLHELVKRKHREIGIATIYRTLKLLVEAGLAREIDLGDGTVRFEHSYRHEHHDHLICTKCGRLIEAVDSRIEELQEELAKQHGFVPDHHSLRIFGTCARCASGNGRKRRH